MEVVDADTAHVALNEGEETQEIEKEGDRFKRLLFQLFLNGLGNERVVWKKLEA